MSGFSAEIFKRNVYRLYFPSVDLGTTHGISVLFAYAQTPLINAHADVSGKARALFFSEPLYTSILRVCEKQMLW